MTCEPIASGADMPLSVASVSVSRAGVCAGAPGLGEWVSARLRGGII